MTSYRTKAEIIIDVTANGLDNAWEMAEYNVNLFKELFPDVNEAKVTEVEEIGYE